MPLLSSFHRYKPASGELIQIALTAGVLRGWSWRG